MNVPAATSVSNLILNGGTLSGTGDHTLSNRSFFNEGALIHQDSVRLLTNSASHIENRQ